MIKRMGYFNTEAISLYIKSNAFDKHVIYADEYLYCQCTGNLYMRYNSNSTDDNVVCIDFDRETKQYVINSAENNKYYLKAALLGVEHLEDRFNDLKEASEFLDILNDVLSDSDRCSGDIPTNFEVALDEYYEELSDGGINHDPKECKIYLVEDVFLKYKLKNTLG